MSKRKLTDQEILSIHRSIQSNTAASSIELLTKIAKNCSFEEFEEFIVKNQIPAVQLNKSELSMLKGGGKLPGVLAVFNWIYEAGKGIYDGYKGNAHGTS